MCGAYALQQLIKTKKRVPLKQSPFTRCFRMLLFYQTNQLLAKPSSGLKVCLSV